MENSLLKASTKVAFGFGHHTTRWLGVYIFSVVMSPILIAAEKKVDINEGTIENILVTSAPLNKSFQVNAGAFGTKSLMEIPLSIQSIGAKAIADTSARTAIDVLASDSSVLSVSYGGSFDNYRLRGFAMDSFNTVRRDGLTLAPHHDFALENIERIDVLKGPSGFLYGFNSPGGTINHLLKRPTKDPLLNVTLQTTSLEGRYAAIDTSASMSGGKFGYRMNAGYEKNGDFDHARDMERKFFGVATDLRLSDSVLLQINTDWSWKSVVADPLLRADQSVRTDKLDPETYILAPKINRRDLLTGSWFRHETEGANVDARLEWVVSENWASITQVNYSRVQRHGGYNDLFDITETGDIGYADFYVSRGEIFSTASVQTYLAGQFSIANLQHDVFVGASVKVLKDKSPFWDFIESANDVSINQVSVSNILNPTQPSEWNFGSKQPIDFISTIKENSLFASDMISFNEQFQVMLGGRYIWYRAKNLSSEAVPQEKNVFVPTGAVIFRPTDNTMLYASYSRGFEKGDYAPFFANNPNEPTDAIASEQYELGFKMQVSNNFHAGAALFDIHRNASYVNLNNDFVSDGEYNHQGVEINLVGQVSSGLKITSNTAYLSTVLEGVTDPATLGKRSEGVPKWKTNLRVQYLVSRVPGLSIDAEVSYVGRRPVDAQNSGFIPAYTLIDAGISYKVQLGDTPVNLRLHGKNLTDKYYYVSAFYQAGLDVGRTREVFFSALINF